MRSDELLSRLRYAAFIGDEGAYPDYSDTVLLQEMTDKLRSSFCDAVLKSRSGYWLKYQIVSSTSTLTDRVRVPARAVVNGLESVEVLGSDGMYYLIQGSEARDAHLFERETGQPYPRTYYLEGGDLVLRPAPTQAQTLRLRYYLRPSKLMHSQSSEDGGLNVVQGQITAVGANQLTVNAQPQDGLTLATISGTLALDVIRAEGWFEPVVVSASGTVSGSNITFSGVDLTGVKIGDWVRVADQTDWPSLPEDFHRLLADAAATKVLRELDISDKAAVLQSTCDADFGRFESVIQPRVKSEPQPIKIKRFGSFRRW